MNIDDIRLSDLESVRLLFLKNESLFIFVSTCVIQYEVLMAATN